MEVEPREEAQVDLAIGAWEVDDQNAWRAFGVAKTLNLDNLKAGVLTGDTKLGRIGQKPGLDLAI